MERPQLSAKRRQSLGTRVVRRMRKAGEIPGIVYGKTAELIPVAINTRELMRLLHAHAGEHGLLDLKVEAAEGQAGKRWEKPVLIKTLQVHPVDGRVLHIDFHAITLTEHIRIKIPVVLQGTSIGVKQDGGILEHFLREIEIDCLPTAIPKQVEYDITNLKLGDTVHVKDLVAPADSKITTDGDSVIASVQAPKVEKPAEEGADALTEPEVIREKKPEEGEDAEGDAKGGKAEKPEKPEKKPEKKEEKK